MGRAIRELLAGLEDPFTRFVTPQQFQALMVFDVTGVGLNLGSTDEFQRKVGFDRPVESYPSDVSPQLEQAWCLGGWGWDKQCPARRCGCGRCCAHAWHGRLPVLQTKCAETGSFQMGWMSDHLHVAAVASAELVQPGPLHWSCCHHWCSTPAVPAGMPRRAYAW